MGRTTNHIHVWKSLLERAGYKLADIPREWEAFWSFWCDEVQPAVRRATGRDDIWGIGLPMSGQAFDTWFEFHQFLGAYEADYVSPDGRLVIDDAEIRRRLVKAIGSYTAVYRKGCTPPESLTWASFGNNEAFLPQRVVMTNETLSIPNALKSERPDATTRTPPRSNGRSAHLASRSRSSVRSFWRWRSRTAATSPRPKSSSAFS
jgi:multiple sugar transport system substrate-binding protein